MAWSEAQKAGVLSTLQLNGGNATKTARETGVPKTTLRKWAKGLFLAPEIPAKVEAAKQDLADMFERVARSAVEAAGGKIEDATFAQTMTGAAIAVDKMRLLREQATSLVGTPLSDQEREAAKREILSGYGLKIVGE